MNEILRVPEEFRWATDGCPMCGADHFKQGCAAVMPVALLNGDDERLQLAYRCRDGHDWTTTFERSYAVGHAGASRDELTAIGHPPYWPATGELSARIDQAPRGTK